MSSAIQNILQRTLGDIARPTKFEAFFYLSDSNTDIEQSDITIQVKTTSFPSKSHTPIDLMFKGRSIPVKGQTKYTQTWECTFHLGEDHSLKNAFELWIEALDQKHNYPENVKGLKDLQDIHNSGYIQTINIYQQNFDADYNTAKYELFNVFPTEVSPIQASYDAVGQTQEFTVTFSYSHFKMEVLKGNSGNFIDEYIAKVQDTAQVYVDEQLTKLGDTINSYFIDEVTENSDTETLDFSRNPGSKLTNTNQVKRNLIFGGNDSDMTNSLVKR